MGSSRDDDQERVSLVKLAPGHAPEAVEQAVRVVHPDMVGSLLTWVGDDWFALCPDLVDRLGASATAHHQLLQDMGVVASRSLSALAFAQTMGLRDPMEGPTTVVLRDRDPASKVFVDPPRYSRPGHYQGRPVLLDWHVAAADFPDAWAQLGQDGPSSYAGISVGHIDTGYTEHPALGWTTPEGTWLRPDLGRNYFKDTVDLFGHGEGPAPWNIVPEYPGPRDNLTGSFPGHGTRTVSVLAGLYAPAHQPIDHPYFGAAPGATIIPYRITDSVLIDHVPDLLAKAVNDAVARGARVISISLGALRKSRRVARAVQSAYEQGVIVCAAAGQVVKRVIYPGRLNCVITVGGATTSNGVDLWPWRLAARGRDVDICGPADQMRRPTTVMHKGQERFRISGPGNGTSFATALCAGLAVLWLARRGPELLTAYGNARWAQVEAFRLLLRETAVVPPGWPTDTYGAGIYQAGALLGAPLPDIAGLTRQADMG